MTEIIRYHHDDLTGEMHPHDHGTWATMTDLDRQRQDFASIMSEREVEHASVVATLQARVNELEGRAAVVCSACGGQASIVIAPGDMKAIPCSSCHGTGAVIAADNGKEAK